MQDEKPLRHCCVCGALTTSKWCSEQCFEDDEKPGHDDDEYARDE